MTTYALVHGAWHGRWCWDQLTPELERLGHATVTVDLPCDDPSASYSTYADVIVGALDDVGSDVVIVAHSMGGLSAPIAAARLRVRGLVFLNALIAAPGRSFLEQVGEEPEMLVPGYQLGLSDPDDLGRTRWVDPVAAWESLYGDCDEDAARAAFDRLRPQAQAPYVEACPLETLPDVRCTYILGTADRIVAPEWSRSAARERLGIEAIELPGGHSPFLARPGELASLLDAVS
jgi:pimeloyl-ACP methyl ester carboxylesterase